MRIYFMGIAGTAMGNVALLLRSLGHEVIGADTNVYPPMSDVLRDAGIAFREGYDAEALAASGADLVVVGNVVSRGNPEVEWLLNTRTMDYDSLPGVLHRMVLAGRDSIVVAGTHGKTTTTALTAHLLRANGRDPGFLIGGVPYDPPTGTHLGRMDDPFVIEGDEYDSAFFDKRSKFIHYAPRIAILNNLEFDHADIFRDLQDVQRSFLHFLRLVPGNGAVLINGDDPNIQALMPISWCPVIRVGMGANNDLRIDGFSESSAGSRFDLIWKEKPWASVTWKQHGAYNARNAAMAGLAAGLSLFPGDPTAVQLNDLEGFRGVKRRQEVRARSAKVTLIEDFGHHPTAIGATLESLRQRFPDAHLVAGFEPRSNTARSRVFQESLIPALAVADRVVVAPVARADRLEPADRLDTEALAEHLAGQGVQAFACANWEDTLASLEASLEDRERQATVMVLFSNGAFGGGFERLTEKINRTR